MTIAEPSANRPVSKLPIADLHVPSDLQQSPDRFPVSTSLSRLQNAAGPHFDQVPAQVVQAAQSTTVLPNAAVARDTVGAANPAAIATLRSGGVPPKLDDPALQSFIERVLGGKLVKLVDPATNLAIYPGLTLGSDGRISAVERVAGGGQGAGNSVSWADAGHFFTDAAQFTDPIQGGLADCYFISALASVAWAGPLLIEQRTLPAATTATFPSSTALDVITFFDSRGAHDIDASELLPQQGGQWIYAHADDSTELWPGVYEKAFAMWKGNTPSEEPDYSVVNYGDPVAAAAALTGGAPSYYATTDIITIPILNIKFDLISAAQIWQTVRANSLGMRTIRPMVAWTYPSASAAPTAIDYGAANLVANHAYSILGWDYQNGNEYIVLRNPWGYYEGTQNVEGAGTWQAWDISYWRQTPLSSAGVFGLRADTFKQYYEGFGSVTFSAGSDPV
jgi:calpain family cysteine protease